MVTNVQAVRAEALFASPLQSSEEPAAAEVLQAVATTLRRFGPRGCAARVAGEFGERPETAVHRMAWALEMIRTVYPTPAQSDAQSVPRPLALAG